MKLALLTITGAAVALTAMPADAQPYGRHYGRNAACAQGRHGDCARWRNGRHMAGYRVGYTFGPRFGYTEYSALPPPIITRYGLRENYRYVNRNGVVYVVNPHSYRVVRVISIP